jgi:hypothetical protein
LLSNAIHFAEQKAVSAAKLNQGAPKTAGADRLNMATQFCVDMAKQYGVPKIAEEKWQYLLESALGVTNTNNPDFAKSVAVKAKA